MDQVSRSKSPRRHLKGLKTCIAFPKDLPDIHWNLVLMGTRKRSTHMMMYRRYLALAVEAKVAHLPADSRTASTLIAGKDFAC
jgi:hypothetical protein